MKISLFSELALPRPWTDDDERQMPHDGLEEVEAAGKAGFSTVWYHNITANPRVRLMDGPAEHVLRRVQNEEER